MNIIDLLRKIICKYLSFLFLDLLHQALKDILGSHVSQAGSLVAPDYLRFDFTHSSKLTKNDIEAIDLLVNDKIGENIACR